MYLRNDAIEQFYMNSEAKAVNILIITRMKHDI